jgi:hypothetical protein
MVFFGLKLSNKAKMPEPNNQTADGTGTAWVLASGAETKEYQSIAPPLPVIALTDE